MSINWEEFFNKMNWKDEVEENNEIEKKTITQDQLFQIIWLQSKFDKKVRKLEEWINAINSSFTVLDFWNNLDILKVVWYLDLVDWIEYWLYECDHTMEVIIDDHVILIKNDNIKWLIKVLRLDWILVD